MTTVQDEKNRIDYLLPRYKITDKEIQKAYDDGLYKLKAVINSTFSLYSTDGVLVPTNLNCKVTKKDTMMRPVKGGEYYHENHRRDYND